MAPVAQWSVVLCDEGEPVAAPPAPEAGRGRLGPVTSEGRWEGRPLLLAARIYGTSVLCTAWETVQVIAHTPLK